MSSRQPPNKEPLSPQTILGRVFVFVIGIAMFFSIFVLPWVMSQ